MVKLGVIGNGRMARTTIELALEQGHEVVALTEDMVDFEDELKSSPSFTCVEGASIHDGDVSRVLKGGEESPAGSIKRTVSGSYGFSVKKMLTGMSQTSGVSTRCSHFTSDSGIISRVNSGLSDSSSVPNRMSSAVSSASHGGEMDELDILLAMLELQNAQKFGEVMSPGALAMARHHAHFGMPGEKKNEKKFDSESEFLPETQSEAVTDGLGMKRSRFNTEDEEVTFFDVPALQDCDCVLIAMTDDHGYDKGTWNSMAVDAVLKHSENMKIFVVVRNAPVRSGKLRQVCEAIDYAEVPNPSGWGVATTTNDQTKTEKLVLEQLQRLNYDNENNNTITLMRVNAMQNEDNRRGSRTRRGTYYATARNIYIPRLGINSADAAQFVVDNFEESTWDNKIVHLHRGNMNGIQVMA